MTQEEKARAYDKALEKSKEFYILCKKCGAKDTVDFLEDSFPELVESEDEKVRKAIIGLVRQSSEILDMQNQSNMLAWLEKQCKQKSIDYDEELRKCRENFLYFFDKYVKIKEKKPIWSETDMSKVQIICKYLNEAKKYYADITEVRECIDWLKSLKDRVIPQSKQEWSEDDVYNSKLILATVSQDQDLSLETKDKLTSWFKSLKPQNHWKPSDEQMEALDNFIFAKYPNIEKYEKSVKSLYNDLKKLKGE